MKTRKKLFSNAEKKEWCKEFNADLANKAFPRQHYLTVKLGRIDGAYQLLPYYLPTKHKRRKRQEKTP